MSEKELKLQELKKIKENREEARRLERLKKYDERIEKSFDKANKYFEIFLFFSVSFHPSSNNSRDLSLSIYR